MDKTTEKTNTGPGNKPDLGNKPGPPKQFPHRVYLRVGTAELDALERITGKGAEDRSAREDKSAIIRRLIHEADKGKGK